MYNIIAPYPIGYYLWLDPRYVKNNGRKQLDLPEKQNSLLEAGLE